MATNGIYSNSRCDTELSLSCSHIPQLLDSLSTDNFGRNINSWITILI